MPTVDGRPGRLDAVFRPGDDFTVTLTGPAGWLSTRAFTATLGGVALAVSEVSDSLEIVASAAITTAASTATQAFVLTETGGNDALVGKWAPRTDGSAHTDLTAAVIIDSLDVSVDVIATAMWGNIDGGAANTIYSATINGGNASILPAGTDVADEITDGVTTIAPSENAVFDALALKANIADLPTQLSTPGLWGWWSPRYMADPVDGNRVFQLTDLSGNGRFIYGSASASAQPTIETNEVNGEPVVRFDGSTAGLPSIMSTASSLRFLHATAFTVIFVYEQTAASNGVIWDTNGGETVANHGTFCGFVTATSALNVAVCNGGSLVAGFTCSANSFPRNVPHVVVMRYAYQRAGDDLTVEVDGVLAGTGDSAAQPSFTSDPSGGSLSLGQRAGTGLSKVTGDLAELMMWECRLTDAEVLSVVGSLETIYGL